MNVFPAVSRKLTGEKFKSEGWVVLLPELIGRVAVTRTVSQTAGPPGRPI